MEEQNFLNGGVIFAIIVTVVGIVVYSNKKQKYKNIDEISDFSTDENDYKEAKFLIDEFIKDKNWEVLEAKLNSLTVKRFPDLKQKIEEALKSR